MKYVVFGRILQWITWTLMCPRTKNHSVLLEQKQSLKASGGRHLGLLMSVLTLISQQGNTEENADSAEYYYCDTVLSISTQKHYHWMDNKPWLYLKSGKKSHTAETRQFTKEKSLELQQKKNEIRINLGWLLAHPVGRRDVSSRWKTPVHFCCWFYETLYFNEVIFDS